MYAGSNSDDLNLLDVEDFGQKADLCVRIREILRNYPEGSSILKELIQNADDAGATEVSFVLDLRQHGKQKLWSKGMASFQGDSLLAFNNSTFTKTDFKSIQRIGDSLKKSTSKGIKTGRFGVGFNSVYHLTDLPQFVSDRYVVMFDPQATFLPNVNPANPGKIIDFLAPNSRNALDTKLCDQFEPLKAFGNDFSKPYKGTLFRLPLRTAGKDGKSSSRLSKQIYTRTRLKEILDQFCHAAPSMLLFLKHVEKISVGIWNDSSDAQQQQQQPYMYFNAKVEAINRQVKSLRAFVTTAEAAAKLAASTKDAEGIAQEQIVDYKLNIRSTWVENGKINVNNTNNISDQDAVTSPSDIDLHDSPGMEANILEEWIVCNQLGGGESHFIATHEDNLHLKLVPWAGVAALLKREGTNGTSLLHRSAVNGSDNNDGGKKRQTTGQVYCFLPLPVYTGLPVHINGYFELSSNRRDIWSGTDMAGDGALRAKWNQSLLEDVVVPCYTRLLQQTAFSLGQQPYYSNLRDYYMLFPSNQPRLPIWRKMIAKFFNTIKGMKLFYSKTGNGRWINGAQHAYLPPHIYGGEDIMNENVDVIDELESIFIKSNIVNIIHGLPPHLCKALLEFQVVKSVLNPKTVRSLLRGNELRDFPMKLLLENQQKNSMGMDNDKEDTNNVNHKETMFLLQFCMSDLDANTYTEMHRIKLLPLCDGHLGVFHKRSNISIEEKMLHQLRDMGFPYQTAWSALQKYNNNIEAASMWLLGLQQMDSSNRNSFKDEAWDEAPFFICSEIENKLLIGQARRAVIDMNVCKPRVEQILRSQTFQQAMQIDFLSPEAMAYLLPDVLPPEWRNIPYVDWNSDNHRINDRDNDKPTSGWIKLFWEYVHTKLNSNIKLFENGCPLVPTTDHKLYTIKRALPILILATPGSLSTDGDDTNKNEMFHENSDAPDTLAPKKEEELINVLKKIGVTCINLDFSGGADATRRLAPRYIQEPKRKGILEVINSVVAIRNSKYSDVFDDVDSTGRDTLRNFLASEDVDKLSMRECKIISRLPIYATYGENVVVNNSSSTNSVYKSLTRNNRYLDSKILSIHEDVIPSNFLKTSSPVELQLLKKLGVPSVNEVTFCVEHLFLNITSLNEEPRNETMLSLLVNFARMCNESKEFAAILQEIPFVPDTEGALHTANDLYDIEVPELTLLLKQEKNVFPCNTFATPMVLSSLRKLGLRDTLSRTKILECASSLSLIQKTDIEFIRKKATCLLRYIDDHSKELFKIPKRSMLSTLNFHTNSSSTDTAQDIENFSEELMGISWVPVLTTKPIENLPWRDGGVGKLETRLPREVRPEQDMWLCSYSLGILRGDIHSVYLKKFFGWDKAIDPRIVAMQLVVLGQAYSPSETLNRELSIQVPKLYKSLSNSCASDAMIIKSVKQILSGTEWVWCGDAFVADEDVAFVTPVNAKPHLYKVPRDMSIGFGNLLKKLGVRDEFGFADFANALSKMHAKYEGKPLQKLDVDIAVSLVQELSNTPMKAANFELFAPNEDNIMMPTREMVYDDAPWLSKRAVSSNITKTQFIHPKISNDVAKNVEVKSFRSTLIANETEDLLNDFDATSFGQVEPLTGRLHHILELYPEGPGIINELIQNADDARATEFAVMLNLEDYGKNSLLGPKMSKWQGPALYVHNNATFSNQDFANLVKIGQASKLEKLSTTGRFGLGFNSVYHFTDLPSFVTGDHVVMFDPHTDYIPRATHQQPGLKLKFSSSKVMDQFPDQFTPYLFFGNDMRSYYNGTLFRFPLRTKDHKSQIKTQPYTINDVSTLIQQFKQNIVHAMVFLRHIKKISVYINEASSAIDTTKTSDADSINNAEHIGPRLLYEAYVSKRDDDSWGSISKFLKTSNSKASMYAKLLRTPEADLPSLTQQVEIKSIYMDRNNNNTVEEEKVDTYLIVQRLGGGNARKIACSKNLSHMKLVPWGGVAAHLNTTSKRVGRAFCFLPLPAETGLPIHVHGYFELSSNRRNIWFGDDMAGEGAIKANWNVALLQDVVSPCYKQLLMEARNSKSPNKYYSLFPQKMPSGPWEVLTKAFFETIYDSPLLYSLVDTGRWISPRQAVLVKKGMFTNATQEQLVKLLLQENIPIVDLKDDTFSKLLLEHECVKQQLSPKEVRAHFKKKTNHPILNNRLDAMFILDVCLQDLQNKDNDASFSDLVGLPLLPLANGSLSMFEGPESNRPIFLCSRWNETRLLSPASDRLVDPKIVGESDERKPADTAFHSIAKALRPYYTPQIEQETNLKQLKPDSFAFLLSCILPIKWKGASEVIWIPGDSMLGAEAKKNYDSKNIDKSAFISELWMTRLWRFLGECSEQGIYDEKDMECFINDWPLLPTQQPKARTLMSLRENMPVINPTGLSPTICNLFARIGVRVLDSRIILNPPARFVQPASPTGCLQAIYYSVQGELDMLPDRFTVLSPATLQDLREYLGTFKWKQYREKLEKSDMKDIGNVLLDKTRLNYLEIMRALPIYEVYGDGSISQSEKKQHFQPLSEDHYLVPDYLKIFEKILNSRFLVTHTSRDKTLLLSLGVKEREVPTSVIAEQLVHMGKQSKGEENAELERTLNNNIIDLYLKLADIAANSPDELDSLKNILKDTAWIWINGKFMKAESVSFRCPQNAAPFLYEVPAYVKANKNISNLWSSLGVREEFAASDFVLALQKLKAFVGEKPMKKGQLDFAVALLQMLAESDLETRNEVAKTQGTLFVPDENSVLCPSAVIVYNDAEWLKISNARYRLCHSNISNTVASKVGIRSLRSIELETRKDMKEFSCPGASSINVFLRTYNNKERIFSDMIEFADEKGATSVAISFDQRTYPSQSIMHPNMSTLQNSSAICIEMNNFALEPNHILDALSLRRAGMTNRLGFNSLFHVSDCLEIISGEYLYIVDPGRRFTKSLNMMQEKPVQMVNNVGQGKQQVPSKDNNNKLGQQQQSAGTIRAYKWYNTNLADKFPNALSSFRAIGQLSRFSHHKKCNGTIIRAALRSEPSSISDNLCLYNDMMQLVNQFKVLTPISCIFTNNVEHVKVVGWSEKSNNAQNNDGFVDPSDLYCTAQVRNHEAMRRSRQKLYQNDDWHTSGITRFFVGWKVQKSKYQLEVQVTEGLYEMDQTNNNQNLHTDADVSENNRGEDAMTRQYVDRYEVQMALGPGKTRDIAIALLNSKFGSLQDLTPLVGIASHTHRNGISPPPHFKKKKGNTKSNTAKVKETPKEPNDNNNDNGNNNSDGQFVGRIMRPAPIPLKTGLPIHIMVYARVNPEANGFINQGDGQQWNSALLNCATGEVYVSLLKSIISRDLNDSNYDKNKSSGESNALPNNNGDLANAQSVYHTTWPVMSKVKPCMKPYISQTLHMALAERPYFYSSMSKSFVKLSKGCFPGKNMPNLAQKFVARRMEILDVPPEVADDLSNAGIVVNRMNPPELRMFLRRNDYTPSSKSPTKRHLGLEEELYEVDQTCLSLLEYCTSDFVIVDADGGAFGEVDVASQQRENYSSLRGLNICPTSDGGVGRFSRLDVPSPNKSFLIGTENDRLLMPVLLNLFVHPQALASESLKHFFQNEDAKRLLGVVTFSPSILSYHIGSVLPSSWKGKLKVQWNNPGGKDGQPTHLWLRRFWRVVDITDTAAVDLFRNYPLVPLCSDELLSCSLVSSALLIDTSKQDNEELNKEMNALEDTRFQEVDEGSDDEVGGDDEQKRSV